MKNISKLIICAVALVSMAACNKAEYVTYNYVSLDARRAKINETVGTYSLPVTVHNYDRCIVTYKVTDGSAKAGEDFEIVDETGNPDPSGTLQITKGVGYIYIKVVNRPGIETGNKSFQIDLLQASTKDVYLGSTTNVKCSIIDADAAINKLIGSWTGTGKDPWGDPASLSLYLDVLEEDSEEAEEAHKKYPNANLMFNSLKFPELTMDSADNNIYGYFDDNTNKVHIYANQAFNEYNFGEEYGELYVALTGQNGSASDDVILSFNKDSNELKADKMIGVGVFSHDDAMDYLGLTGGYNAGFILTKVAEVTE